MNNKFNILDKVYHITPESPTGFVLDIAYYFGTKRYNYLVSWSHNDSSWVLEEELSETKTFQ